MAIIQRPRPKPLAPSKKGGGFFSDLLGATATFAGGAAPFLGPAAPVALGISAGAGLGRTLADTSGSNFSAPSQVQPPEGVPLQSNAVDRRLGNTGPPPELIDRLALLREAEKIIPTLPIPVRQEVSPPIFLGLINTAREIQQMGGLNGSNLTT